MKAKTFSTEQFTATKWDDAEAKKKWANAMAAWVQKGFPEKTFRRGLYEHLSIHMYGHIAHYNKQGFQNTRCRLAWLKYAAREGAFGCVMGDPAWAWSDVEAAFSSWIRSSGLIEQYEDQYRRENEARERALLAELQAKYPDQAS